jgi:outer membrane receptor protein involved in Fe transport
MRDDAVDQSSAGVFGQADIQWTRVFRTTLGLRGDTYRFNVRSRNTLNSGSGVDSLVSPKFTAVLGPWQNTEIYVNGGYGFHSNDARGATITIDPGSGNPAQRLGLLTRARGAELGVRSVRLEGVQSTVSVWYLGFDSELVFVGDSGGTDVHRPSRRLGIEWTNYVRLNLWMTAQADLSLSRARFTDHDPAGDRIPGALERVLAAALTIEPTRRVFGSIRVRHFGARPLIEDGTVNSASTTIWNGGFGVTISRHLRLSVDGFNLLDSKASEVEYFYTSRLRGEPPDGVNDIHTHPSLPRMARITLVLTF